LIRASEIRPIDATKTAARRRAWGKLFFTAGALPLAVSGVLAVATALECHSVNPGINSLGSWALSLLYGGVLWLWWALVVEVLWRTGGQWPSTLRVSLGSSTSHLFVAVGVALIHLGILQLTVYWLSRVGPPTQRAEYYGLDFFHLWRFGIEVLLYALIWVACAALDTQLAAQRGAMRSLELERQLASAHLRALQMQLEPHFLFNTLNAITTLMELGRRQDALDTLGHLNTILQTVLKRNAPRKIPLTQELEIVESYLAIERVRFADRLRVDLSLDPNALDGLVPSFLLQPIIENAIRHGVARCERDGCIETSAKRVGTRLQLQVRDNGPGLNGEPHPGFGVGLSNTRDRLIHFYQDDYELHTLQPESGGFEVSITIPYERAAS
jgi:sensor histidine kinase YesM